MPIRSTPFQKLVHHLQTHLCDGHEVTESAMLRHRLTGELREVDVVLRTLVGEHPIVVSVECIDRARPADTTWVEQMKTKHEHLETNRLVLVSRSGFYQPALSLADALGIATYTPDTACDEDWTQIVGKGQIFVSRYDFRALASWVRIQGLTGPQLLEAGDPTRLCRTDQSSAGTLGDLIAVALLDRSFAVPAMQRLNNDPKLLLQLEFSVDAGLCALDTSEVMHPLLGFRINVEAIRRTSYLDLTSIKWRGTPAAFGHDQTVLGATTLTFVEKQLGELDAQVVVDGRAIELYRVTAVGEPTAG